MNDIKKIVINEIRVESAGTKSYFFDIPEDMTWDAGSDIHMAYTDYMSSGIPDKALIRHMSIITLPEEGKVGFTTRVPGSGSPFKKRLDKLKPGDEMMMYKLGNRFPLRREEKPVVLISMGVGVSVVRPMILSWMKDATGIPSISNLMVDKKVQLPYRKKWEMWETPNLTHIFSENREAFHNNFESLGFEEEKVYYLVGSDGFLEEIIKRLLAKGVSPDNIEIDKKPEKKAQMLGK